MKVTMHSKSRGINLDFERTFENAEHRHYTVSIRNTGFDRCFRIHNKGTYVIVASDGVPAMPTEIAYSEREKIEGVVASYALLLVQCGTFKSHV